MLSLFRRKDLERIRRQALSDNDYRWFTLPEDFLRGDPASPLDSLLPDDLHRKYHDEKKRGVSDEKHGARTLFAGSAIVAVAFGIVAYTAAFIRAKLRRKD